MNLIIEPLKFDFQPDAIKAFTEGDCYLLAMELHMQYGYEFVFFGDKNPQGGFTPNHGAVLASDTMVIDIVGVRPINEVERRFGEMFKGPFTPSIYEIFQDYVPFMYLGNQAKDFAQIVHGKVRRHMISQSIKSIKFFSQDLVDDVVTSIVRR